ncbi:transaldolase [Cutibacterium acnes JCM 18916]|nr:transaldolase [Cutibacterium acnes JCM 18916]
MKINYTPGPLLDASRTTPTALWNDSADLDELRQSIAFGGVGATCNPVIGYTTIKKHPDIWEDRIRAIAENNPTWGESQIGWQAIKDMSVEAAKLLEPIFVEHKGRNGRLSIQTDPRCIATPRLWQTRPKSSVILRQTSSSRSPAPLWA